MHDEHYTTFLIADVHGEVSSKVVQVAQAGSQGDKKARRVLSLRAHHLKENLLKTKTDLGVHKAACRHQAYRIGQPYSHTPISSCITTQPQSHDVSRLGAQIHVMPC